MVFSYSPNQLYKIYCRMGFITDLAFKKGETINYVGGGDTAGGCAQPAAVALAGDGRPLQLKPGQYFLQKWFHKNVPFRPEAASALVRGGAPGDDVVIGFLYTNKS